MHLYSIFNLRFFVLSILFYNLKKSCMETQDRNGQLYQHLKGLTLGLCLYNYIICHLRLHRPTMCMFVLYSTCVRCEFVKSSEVTLCGLLGYWLVVNSVLGKATRNSHGEKFRVFRCHFLNMRLCDVKKGNPR